LFVVEGLLVYLDEGTILGVHGGDLDSSVVVALANAARPDAGTEPWRTVLPADRHLELLSESGWTVVEAVDDAALGTGAIPGRSLCAVAIR
jgi:hypothetical protein